MNSHTRSILPNGVVYVFVLVRRARSFSVAGVLLVIHILQVSGEEREGGREGGEQGESREGGQAKRGREETVYLLGKGGIYFPGIVGFSPTCLVCA